MHSNACVASYHPSSTDQIWRQDRNRGLQPSRGDNRNEEKYDGILGKGFTALSSVFKEKSKFTKQNSGSGFLAEGTMSAKTMTLNEHGLMGDMVGKGWHGWTKEHAGR